MLLGLRKDPELARLLHLPSHIKQEGGTREAFERVFQAMDDHMDRHITYNEFEGNRIADMLQSSMNKTHKRHFSRKSSHAMLGTNNNNAGITSMKISSNI